MDSRVAPSPSGSVLILEAPAGRARHAHLQQRMLRERESGATVWLLECHRVEGGPWAGLKDLLGGLLPALREKAPGLLQKHDYELAHVLPELRRTLTVRNPTLTDVSPDAERTRNYAADRAFRIPQGLVDLLDAWRPHTGAAPWVILCDDFEHAGALTRLFFTELMRRRGEALNLRLVLSVAPGAGEAVARQFHARVPRQHESLDLPVDPPVAPPSPEEMARKARALAPEAPDLAGLENVLPRLIRYWQASNEPERALQALVHAASVYTSRGFYEDALVYGEAALEQLERQRPDDVEQRMHIYNRLSNCYSALRRVDEGLAVADKAMAATDDPGYLLSWCYIQAMYHARYLPKRDYARAEAYLEEGLEHIARADLPLHARLFRRAFNRNGLAMIRHFQKRYDEAITLCRTAFDELNAQLGPDEHQLHRSVLLYNVAQVYAVLGKLEEAVEMYSAAMERDPNYSEYFNERGGLYLKLDRLEEAERDFLRAIELSPPYMEVWTNLGQCYNQMGRMEEAVMAYSRALDLNPQQGLALAGRGHAYEALGDAARALADYDETLRINPSQPVVYASRAVLRYEAGRVADSLGDLDQAIRLAPDMADLYQNRATALRDLGRLDEASRDLRKYLVLSPHAEDRLDVERLLTEVEARRATA